MLNGTYLLSKVWIRENYDNYVHFYPADPEYPTLATLAALTLMLSILPQLRRILNRSQFPSRPLFSSPSALRRLFAPTVMPAKALPKWTWLSADTTLYEVTLDTPHVAGGGRTIGHTGVRIEGNNPRTATSTIRGANNLVMTTMVKVGTNSDRQHEKNDCCRIRTDLH